MNEWWLNRQQNIFSPFLLLLAAVTVCNILVIPFCNLLHLKRCLLKVQHCRKKPEKSSIKYMILIYRIYDWVTGWMILWLIDWFLFNYLFDKSGGWLPYWLIDLLVGWLIEWSFFGRFNDWLIWWTIHC